MSSLWQEKQRSGLCARSSAFSGALCGLWHFEQSPFANAAWTLLKDPASLAWFWWHRKQVVFWSFASIPRAFEPWASWQPRQSPSTNGLWFEPVPERTLRT